MFDGQAVRGSQWLPTVLPTVLLELREQLRLWLLATTAGHAARSMLEGHAHWAEGRESHLEKEAMTGTGKSVGCHFSSSLRTSTAKIAAKE